MSMRLFIGGMSASTKASDLRGHFEAMDGVEVVDAIIIMDKETGRSKGFGFVELNTERLVVDVVQRVHGTKIAGSERCITVGEAHARPERQVNQGSKDGNVRRFVKTNGRG